MMESNLNLIIKETIESLMQERDQFIEEITKTDCNIQNSSIRVSELESQILTIDTRIDSLLDRLK